MKKFEKAKFEKPSIVGNENLIKKCMLYLCYSLLEEEDSSWGLGKPAGTDQYTHITARRYARPVLHPGYGEYV